MISDKDFMILRDAGSRCHSAFCMCFYNAFLLRLYCAFFCDFIALFIALFSPFLRTFIDIFRYLTRCTMWGKKEKRYFRSGSARSPIPGKRKSDISDPKARGHLCLPKGSDRAKKSIKDHHSLTERSATFGDIWHSDALGHLCRQKEKRHMGFRSPRSPIPGKKKSDISNPNTLGHPCLPESQRPGEQLYKRSPLLDRTVSDISDPEARGHPLMR